MGLTNRLSDALIAEEKRSTTGAQTRSCVLYIPENVDYSLKADRSFDYKAEVYLDKPNGTRLFAFAGTCSERDLRACAAAILTNARRVPVLQPEN